MANSEYDVEFGDKIVRGVKFIATHKLQEEAILEFTTKDIRGLLSLDGSTILTGGFSTRQKTVWLPYSNSACCANHVLVVPLAIKLTRDSGEATFTCRFESSTGLDPLAFAENSILPESEVMFGESLGKLLIDGNPCNAHELNLFISIYHETHRGSGSVFPNAFTWRDSGLSLLIDNHPIAAKDSVEIYMQKMWSKTEQVPSNRPVHGLIRLKVQTSGTLQPEPIEYGVVIP